MTNGRLNELRCKKCDKKLGANFEGRLEIVCPRCGYFNKFEYTLLDAFSKQTLDSKIKIV